VICYYVQFCQSYFLVCFVLSISGVCFPILRFFFLLGQTSSSAMALFLLCLNTTAVCNTFNLSPHEKNSITISTAGQTFDPLYSFITRSIYSVHSLHFSHSDHSLRSMAAPPLGSLLAANSLSLGSIPIDLLKFLTITLT
jgi:hypothetical protein